MSLILRLIDFYQKGIKTNEELALDVIDRSEELDLNYLTLLPEETMTLIKTWILERDSINDHEIFNFSTKTFINPSGFQNIRRWIMDHNL